MYFEEAPKRDLKDLYDYREELDRLIEAIRGGAKLIVIEGLRRTGKTSLLLTALAQTEQPSIVIDAREFSSAATITRRDLIRALEAGLNQFLAEKRGWRERLSAAVEGVHGVEVEPSLPPRVSLSWGGRRREAADLASLLEALGRAAGSHGTSFLIALDEAQEFRRLAGINLAALMAHVYDYVKGVQWIVTGSQVGVLHDFLGVEAPRAPMFGRALTGISLRRLSPEDSKDFLKLGFSQVHLTVDDDVLTAIVEKLDGIIGWLTYVGVVSWRRQRFDETVVAEAIKMGSELAALEFTNYLSIRPQARARYTEIMRAMAEAPRRWSEIKRAVENAEGRTVTDFLFNQLLANLVKAGFVDKRPDGLYGIADPLLSQALRDRLV